MYWKKPALVICVFTLSLICGASAPADKKCYYMCVEQMFSFDTINIVSLDLDRGYREEVSSKPLIVSSCYPWKIQAKLVNSTCSYACRISLKYANNPWSPIIGTAYTDIKGLSGKIVTHQENKIAIKVDVDWWTPPFDEGRGTIAIKMMDDI